MDLGSQVPINSSHTGVHTQTPVGLLTWNSDAKVLRVLCHHLLLQFVQSGS